MLASICENSENVGPEKFVRGVEKKHFKKESDFKKQLEWGDEKVSREQFQQRYKKTGKDTLK
jgi:hypothetical protein